MARKSKKKLPKRTKSSIAKSRTVRVSKPKARQRRKVLPTDENLIRGTVTGGSGDPLDFQISAEVNLPRGTTITARVITEAIRYRIKKGRNPRGIRLTIIRWRNPARRHTNPDWRYPDDPEVKENARKMGYGPPMSPQQAAWVTLSAALEAIQVADISIRNR
jgi:hypothetical protein